MTMIRAIAALILSMVSCQANLQAMMIADVINTMERPSSIIAMLCWSLDEKEQLFHHLSGQNVTQKNMVQFLKQGFVPQTLGRDQQILFLIDLTCPDASKHLKRSSVVKLFRSPFRWLLIGGSYVTQDNQTIVPPAVVEIDILPDSEVVVTFPVGDEIFALYLIYRIGSGTPWHTENYGSWDRNAKFQNAQESAMSTASRRINLNGFTISVCFVVTDNNSIYHLSDGIDDHIDTITKVNFPTTNQLLDFLNANRRYVFANTWGYLINGSWNGMTGYLVREEVEIGGSPMFFTSERISFVEYISSPTPTRSKFVFQQPKLSYENNLFLLSFRTNVWYSSIALIFLVFIVLFAVTIWEWKKRRNIGITDSSDQGVLRANVSDVIILVFGATCQQGSPVELKGSLGRVVMLVLFLALMFLYTSYAANIVALLQSSSSQIRTLDDLLHSRIKFGVHDTVFNRYYFSTATEPVRKAIYENKVAPPRTNPRFMTMEEGVQNLQKGLFAFHMETGVGYKFVGKYFHEGEKCGLKEIQYLQVIDPYLAVRKNTPYKEMFKIGLKRIHEHGLQSRQNRLFYEKRPKCTSRGASFVSVSMVDCYPALLVLSYGALVATFLLGIEILIHKRQAVLLKIGVERNLSF